MDKPNSPHKQPDKQLQRKPPQNEATTRAPVSPAAATSLAGQLVGQPLATPALPAELTTQPQGLYGAGALAQQVQLVTKPGVLTAQRQAAVAEIGQKQGNRHAAQVVQHALATNPKSQTSTPKSQVRTAPIQRTLKAPSSRGTENGTAAEPLALGGELEALGGDGGKTWAASGAPPTDNSQIPNLNFQSPIAQIQRESARGEGGFEASDVTTHRIATRQGGGSPLPDETRAFMEPRFGADFGDVRVHTDSEAVQLSRDLSAQAFTHGSDIYFGEGKYDPASGEGQQLLAHELTHVVQQNSALARAIHHPQGTESFSDAALVTQESKTVVQRCACGKPIVAGEECAECRAKREADVQRAALAVSTLDPLVQRVVDPNYVVDDPQTGRGPAGAPTRIFFARNSSTIPASEDAKIDAFKSGPDRTVNLTLLGLATEDEIAASATLPADRANVVNTALSTARVAPPPFNTAHTGTRTVTPGTLAHTQHRSNLRFNRAVELMRPGQATMSPNTPIAPPTPCGAAIEADFQAAKTMAFDWIDTTRPEVQARPVTGAIATLLDQFFGNHDASTARRVDHNLGLIRAEIDSLAQAANHNCADPNLPGCMGAIAFNSGGTMTICSGYSTHTPEDRARNLVHEAGHSTASLRVTGSSNAPRTSDFAYRHERMIHQLGNVNPDQALSNSDSYSMFLMTRRASAAITPNLLPTADPAPSGFANTAQSDKVQRAIALAQVWFRLADQGLTDLHGELRSVGVGNPVPSNLGDPRRLDRILAQVKARFPPILASANISSDDLLMIAGVIDRYAELKRLIGQPIASSPGATTALTVVPPVPPATTGSLTLVVSPAFLAANEQARARVVVDKVIELVSTTRISVAMRSNYGAFAEFVRNLHQ